MRSCFLAVILPADGQVGKETLQVPYKAPQITLTCLQTFQIARQKEVLISCQGPAGES